MRGSGTRQRPLSLLQNQNQNQKQYQNQKQNQKQKQPDLPPFAAVCRVCRSRGRGAAHF